MKRLLRGMASALLLKRFSYTPSYVVSEEDRVFGIAPAEQEESPASVAQCAQHWDRLMGHLSEILDFLAPTPENLTRAIVSSQAPGVQKYRPNTAFIIMQIDDKIPKLEDVKNSVLSARLRSHEICLRARSASVEHRLSPVPSRPSKGEFA